MKIVSSGKFICLQVMGSKTKIFIVLEFVTGGELFDKIVSQFTLCILCVVVFSLFDGFGAKLC